MENAFRYVKWSDYTVDTVYNDYSGCAATIVVIRIWSVSMSSMNVGTSMAMRISAAVTKPVVIHAHCGGRINFAELWRFRDLLWFLALRDIQVRYKQTILGAAWAVIQPLGMMVVFSVVFGRYMNVTDRISGPYPIFLYAALLPWTFFASSVSASSNSLIANANMLRKVYFPRLIVPLSAVGAPLVDYAIAFTILVGLMMWYSVAISWQIIFLPLLVFSTIITALGVGVLLSAITVSYRDFRHVIPFMLQVWLFLTPVVYPLEFETKWAWLFNLNPMAGTISAFRSAVLGESINYSAWGMSLTMAVLLLAIGLFMFKRNERRFADIL